MTRGRSPSTHPLPQRSRPRPDSPPAWRDEERIIRRAAATLAEFEPVPVLPARSVLDVALRQRGRDGLPMRWSEGVAMRVAPNENAL